MVDEEKLSKSPFPLTIRPDRPRAAFHFQIPLTPEAVDFMRECVEDVWNTGPDMSKPFNLKMLPKWSVGWHALEYVNTTTAPGGPTASGTYWIKEAVFEDLVRIQCIVYAGSTDGLQRPPHIEFRWDVKD